MFLTAKLEVLNVTFLSSKTEIMSYNGMIGTCGFGVTEINHIQFGFSKPHCGQQLAVEVQC